LKNLPTDGINADIARPAYWQPPPPPETPPTPPGGPRIQRIRNPDLVPGNFHFNFLALTNCMEDERRALRVHLVNATVLPFPSVVYLDAFEVSWVN
jgi:hypothetical protein